MCNDTFGWREKLAKFRLGFHGQGEERTTVRKNDVRTKRKIYKTANVYVWKMFVGRNTYAYIRNTIFFNYNKCAISFREIEFAGMIYIYGTCLYIYIYVYERYYYTVERRLSRDDVGSLLTFDVSRRRRICIIYYYDVGVKRNNNNNNNGVTVHSSRALLFERNDSDSAIVRNTIFTDRTGSRPRSL